ncbi:hypothetical protein GOODEAATRI_002427, partial [Goodea atripinnis]
LRQLWLNTKDVLELVCPPENMFPQLHLWLSVPWSAMSSTCLAFVLNATHPDPVEAGTSSQSALNLRLN